jgi:hypothetical protein
MGRRRATTEDAMLTPGASQESWKKAMEARVEEEIREESWRGDRAGLTAALFTTRRASGS